MRHNTDTVLRQELITTGIYSATHSADCYTQDGEQDETQREEETGAYPCYPGPLFPGPMFPASYENGEQP